MCGSYCEEVRRGVEVTNSNSQTNGRWEVGGESGEGNSG